MWWLLCPLALAAPSITAEGARLKLESGAVVTADSAQVTPDGVGAATGVEVAHDEQSITIRADHTRWDLSAKTSEMTGTVQATQGDISLSCDRATL